MLKRIILSASVFFAQGFGVGQISKAPGTWGTLLAVPLVFFAASFGRETYLVSTWALCFFGIFICYAAELRLGKDHPSIVFDEIAGFFVTMAFVPLSLQTIVVGFVLFRIFDIFKPFPIRKFESLPWGVGVMADDCVAGFFAGVLLDIIFA